LLELKQGIERWRDPDLNGAERDTLCEWLQAQALTLDLPALPAAALPAQVSAWVQTLSEQLLELEYALIPHGLHVLGRAPSRDERVSTLKAMAQAMGIERDGLIEAVVDQGPAGLTPQKLSDLNDAQRKSLAQLCRATRLCNKTMR